MNVGDVVGSYRITRVLGEGGMGVVYVGSHELIGREAAIKVLLPSLSKKQDIIQRFFNEAKTTTSIKHPGIVEIYDFGYSEEGHAFLVMELLEGETLDSRIKRLRKLPPDMAMSLLSQLARSLGAAHAAGVVHRDLKPENIYIVADPEVSGGERTKVLDFGIAKLRNTGAAGMRTAAGQVMGPPGYMAPEQCLGASEVDSRADIYSLGCILFDMLCGRPPFASTSFADMMAAQVSREPPAPSSIAPSVSAQLDRLTLWMLRKAPEERPQSTDELLAEIAKLGPAGARPRPTVAPAPRPRPSGSAVPPPIPAAARRKPAGPRTKPPPPRRTAPPPQPRPSASVEVAPDLIDSAAPLPPLPAPKAGGLPTSVPRASAQSQTMFEGAAPVPAAPVARAQATTVYIEDQSVPPTPEQAWAPVPPPVATAPAINTGPDPFGVTLAAPGAGDLVADAPIPVPPNTMPREPAYPGVGPQHLRPAEVGALGPRVGHSARPSLPPRPRSGSGWKAPLLVVLVAAAGAGGFFIYKSQTSNGQMVAAQSEPASAASDAAPLAPPVDLDGGPVVSSIADASPAAVAIEPPAADAGAVEASPVADAAAVIATAPVADAAAAIATAPAADAAPTADPIAPPDVDAAVDRPPVVVSGRLRSGRVVDPALSSATGDDGVDTVILNLRSDPPGAIVIREHDQLALGKTPLEYMTRKFNQKEEFVIRLEGYYDVTARMSTNRDGLRLMKLLRKPKGR